jgi:hypothetical protein
MVDEAEKQITREQFRETFLGFAPLKPFQQFITQDHIDQFFRFYQSHLREESNFRQLSAARVNRGIVDSQRFMSQANQKIEAFRLWVIAFEAKKLPWADSLAQSILEEIDKFRAKIRQEFKGEMHMIQLRKSYVEMRPLRFSLDGFIMALDKFINREIEVPPGKTREEFTNLLIAGAMVGTTLIPPIEAKRFDETTRGRIRQLIYNARKWDRDHPFNEVDVGMKKWTSRGDERTEPTSRPARGKRTGERRSRGKNKRG